MDKQVLHFSEVLLKNFSDDALENMFSDQSDNSAHGRQINPPLH